MRMMSAGPFRRVVIAFSAKPDDGKIPDQRLTELASSLQNGDSSQQRRLSLDKAKRHTTTTKASKTMSFLPPIPFSAGAWSVKEENGLNIGQRIRRKRPVCKKDDQPQSTSTTKDENDNHVPTKQLGQALQRAQGSMSRLWKRKSQLQALTCITNESLPFKVSTRKDDDHITHCQSEDNLYDTSTRQVLSPRIHGETSNASRSTSSSSISTRLFKQFRNRKVDRAYVSSSHSEERVDSHGTFCHDEDSDFVSPTVTPTSMASMDCAIMDFLPKLPCPSLPNPTVSIAVQDPDESFIDVDSTDGVQPSVTDLSMAMDSSICLEEEPLLLPWEPPKPKQRKPRKPRHGDDSILIGMIITFDPTAELLNLGKEPQCIAKSFLGELQKNDDHQGHLLGDWKEEESTEELPSFSELLGFHLDCFGPPPEIDTAWDEEPKYPFLSLHEEEEIDFVFQHGLDDSDAVITKIIDLPEGQDSDEEEIEIVFYPVDHVHCPEDEEEGISQASSTKQGSDSDCQSHSSEGSPLPLEWMLPKLSVKVVTSGSLLLDPPEYEWFHPDHQDVELPNHHTPLALFGAPFGEKHRNSVTPSTVGETLSFDVQTSFDGSEGSGVISSGSLPSEAVQSLVEFCHLSETCHSEYMHHYHGLFPSVAPSISMVSQVIDF